MCVRRRSQSGWEVHSRVLLVGDSGLRASCLRVEESTQVTAWLEASDWTCAPLCARRGRQHERSASASGSSNWLPRSPYHDGCLLSHFARHSPRQHGRPVLEIRAHHSRLTLPSGFLPDRRLIRPLRTPQPANLHLNSVTAILLIDSDGHRLLAKYYQPAHVDPKAAGPAPFRNPFQTEKEKRAFEQHVWDKTRRSQGKSRIQWDRNGDHGWMGWSGWRGWAVRTRWSGRYEFD